jgi:Protein of unknown function (DUF3592)
LFLGLCFLFALVTTAAGAWYEHLETSWPQASAMIKHCRAGRSFYGRPAGENPFIIECLIVYEVEGTQVETTIHSATSLSPAVFASMAEWVGRHAPGATIAVRYDPTNHSKAVLTATDMPYGGPRTPGNLRTLALFALACAVVLLLALMTRPSAATRNVALGR